MIDKDLLAYCGHTKRYVWYTVGLQVLRLLAGIGFSFLAAYTLNSFFTGNAQHVFFLIAGAVLIIVIKQAAIRAAARMETKVVKEVKIRLREAVYKKIIEQGAAYQEKHSTQEIIHLAVTGIEQLEHYFGGYAAQIYYSFISAGILFFMLFPFNAKAAGILLVTALVIPLFLMLIMRMVRNVQRNYWKKYSDVGDLFLDSLQGLTTLKIFQADYKRSRDMSVKAEQFRKQTMRLLAMQLNTITIIDWIAYGGTAGMIVLSIYQFAALQIGLFNVILVILLAAEFFVPMRSLTSLFHVAMTGAAAAENTRQFLNEPSIRTYGNEVYPCGGSIKFDELSYQYPDGTTALTAVSMQFEPKKMTAVAGPSGCGKSTIGRLICGQLSAPHSLYYNTYAQPDFKPGELSSHIAYIGHDGHIFEGSLRNNLLMGRTDIADPALFDVMETLQLTGFLQENQGLDTILLSQGKNISGGQAQRISLARALLGDYDVFIFDEAASNIDIESEQIILQIIQDIARTKTVVYISHRMDTICHADFIYVLKDGTVAEQGNHNALVQKSGLYKTLYDEQIDLTNFRTRHLKEQLDEKK